jgi:hypothetical protein
MAEPTFSLLNTLPAEYGTKFDDHVLEQYKLYVDTTQKLSDRRLATNSYLLTINSSLLTLLGLLATLLPERRPLVLIPVTGLLLSIAWALLLYSFRRLNSAKFAVIQTMEEHLPANVFGAEWRRLRPGGVKTYVTMTTIELIVPLLFVALYAFLAWFVWQWRGDEGKARAIEIRSPVEVHVTNPAPAGPRPSPPLP